jgi:DNA polymerase
VTALHLDYESRSIVDLKKAGAYVYAEDPTTDVWCASYAIDNGPVTCWHPDLDDRDIKHAIKYAETISAWNAAFERAITAGIMVPRYGWPTPRAETWRCVMVQAIAMALPGKLDQCAPALHMNVVKDKVGHALMLRMAKPRKPKKGEPTDKLLWWDDEERRQRLYAYCDQDVEVERNIERMLLPLRRQEQELWQLDQVINDRGIYVDRALCTAALQVVDTTLEWLNDELAELTKDEGNPDGITKTTQVAQLTAWLATQGVSTESLDKERLGYLLERTDIADNVRRVLEIRAEGAGSATKKIGSLLAGTNSDSRARGLLQFHAASTGRWGGRRFQPQNIKRPKHKKLVPAYIDAVATGSADFVRLVQDEPLAVVADCLRGMVGAAPGNHIFAADFSNIEGRLIAWLAGEEWKLQAFRDFDAGIGHDIYHLTAGKVLGKDPGPVDAPTITDEERQGSGKVPELALGYQGGVGAFQNMAKIYGVVVTDERADEIKNAWRDEHPRTVQMWRDLEEAAKNAIAQPGKTFFCCAEDRIAFRVAGTFLYMRLPSGRAICYPFPCIKRKLMPWTKQGEMILPERVGPCMWCDEGRRTDGVVCEDCDGTGTVVKDAVYEQLPVWKDSICYKGQDQFTRQWTDQFAHGGLLANNAVQGTARDVEADAMVRLADAGYETRNPLDHGIVLTVHDEIVCETPAGFGSLDEFKAIVGTNPAWAPGLPLAVSGFCDVRYRK